jgi:hypothetical protein
MKKDLESYFKPKQDRDVTELLEEILKQLVEMNEKLDKLNRQPHPSPS